MPPVDRIKEADGAARPATSIIVRTLNEEALLGETLRRLHAQTFGDFEIIVVDSGSTDRTIDIARSFPRVTVIEISSAEFTFGRALNIGCRHSRGDILVFLSAHALPGTNEWLARLLKYFDDPRVAGTWGSQRKRPEAGREPRLVRQDLAMFMRDVYFGFCNSNGAARKSVWEKFPFHDLMPGSEDKEWAHRVLSNGYLLVHDSEAFVVHRHDDSIRQAWWRSHREHLGYTYFLPDYRVGLAANVRWGYYAMRDGWELRPSPGRVQRFAWRVARVLAAAVGRHTGSRQRPPR